MKAILATEAVGVRRNGVDLLSDVTLEVGSGQVTVVIGPNGAGKSTLLKVLSGELVPQRGRVLLNGEPLGAIAPWRLACVRAVLPQSVTVTMPFTARDIVRLGCEGIGRGLRRRDRDALVEAALAQADADRLSGRVVHTLSGGEQQRVHFARVLCQLAAGRTLERDQILLLDEPIANLDLRHQIGLLDHAAALAGAGTAVFAVLHDLNLAAAYAANLVVLHGGTLVAQGPPAEVLTSARLQAVFGVSLPINTIPERLVPFVLPTGPRERVDFTGRAPTVS